MSDAINIILYSIVVLFTVNIFYKLLVNQGQAKQMKENVENMNKQLREVQKEGNKEKASQILSDIMREQGRIMRMSMKPLFVSFIIVGIFLYLIGNTYGDKLVQLNDNKGTVMIDGNEYTVEKIDKVAKIGSSECEMPCKKIISNSVWEISDSKINITESGKEIEKDVLSFARVIASLPVSLPVIGSEAGFLGWYIIVSVPTMIILRKLMKIYT